MYTTKTDVVSAALDVALVYMKVRDEPMPDELRKVIVVLTNVLHLLEA